MVSEIVDHRDGILSDDEREEPGFCFSRLNRPQSNELIIMPVDNGPDATAPFTG
ncbi:hypothetical protein [Rothia uropygioeca]|uniref:hypothetical protein n=1 Tax=Kocuria sp. 257 TaxID=2021970 RepID=UPI0013EC37CF|nr:hypothetical protein [Kocuria sp. 257]